MRRRHNQSTPLFMLCSIGFENGREKDDGGEFFQQRAIDPHPAPHPGLLPGPTLAGIAPHVSPRSPRLAGRSRPHSTGAYVGVTVGKQPIEPETQAISVQRCGYHLRLQRAR